MLLYRFTEAEEDCSLALALDSSYVKAYYRRATARVKLGKLQEAKLGNGYILMVFGWSGTHCKHA